MALINALLRYKQEGHLASFDMHGEKKATLRFANGKSVLVYMSNQYIIGGAEVVEAASDPPAKFLLYNNWDTVGGAAFADAKRLGIEIHKFGAFGHRLDEMNA